MYENKCYNVGPTNTFDKKTGKYVIENVGYSNNTCFERVEIK